MTEQPNGSTSAGRPGFGQLIAGGEGGQVAFEYALVTAAIVVPLTIVSLYVFRVLLDMYRATMLVINLPWP
jgi:hypothetical protein